MDELIRSYFTGHVDATLFLLNNDANIGLVDVNDMNALELAVLGNKRDVAEAIIKLVTTILALTKAFLCSLR